MDNAADRKQIRAAEKATKLAEQNRGEVIVALAGTEPGRRYLWERIADANVFSSTYSDDPQRMAFNEGVRSLGLDVLNDFMRYAPDNFILAMREANGRRTESDARTSANRTAGELDGITEPGWEPEEHPSAGTDAGAEGYH